MSRSTAAQLCTSAEMELVDASYPPQAKQLSPARLRQKVARARKLRDKYRDLARRQRLESRGKSAQRRTGRKVGGHERTDRKAELFAEVLERFETQLARTGGDAMSRQAAEKRAARKTTPAKSAGKKSAGKKSAGKKSAGKKSAGKKSAGKKSAGKKSAGKKAAGKKAAGKAASKTAGRKSAGKKAAGKAASKTAGRKSAGKKSATRIGTAPAEGGARPAAPGRPGAAALKGARQRPDAKQQARGKTARAHNRAAGQRSQRRRDSR